jgi:AcrR family transcriptional regulator
MTTSLRRVPSQERSAKRVSAMLDACAQIVAERGYDGLTTTLVAERAGVAIGSLYQFFPDKRAIALALADRNRATFVERVTARCDRESFADWREAVEAVLEEFLDMHRSVPGFSEVRFGDDITERGAEADEHDNLAVSEQLATMLAERLGVIPAPEIAAAIANAVEVGDALVKRAFRSDPSGDPATIAEAKWIIQTYLARHLSPA